MIDKFVYKFLDFVMEWSGKINSWAWVKHLKYIEKRRFERNFKGRYDDLEQRGGKHNGCLHF